MTANVIDRPSIIPIEEPAPLREPYTLTVHMDKGDEFLSTTTIIEALTLAHTASVERNRIVTISRLGIVYATYTRKGELVE